MTGRSAIISTFLFILAAIIAAVAVSVISADAWLRWRVDATKSRSYSLSEQTIDLLDGLDGDWQVSIVLVESQADPATVRQVDEVLARFNQTNDVLAVQRIDPTRPESLRAYESLLLAIRGRYQEEIDLYETAISRAVGEFSGLIRFAEENAGKLADIGGSSSDAMAVDLSTRAGALSLLASQGQLILKEVEKALRVDDSRPLPDFTRASTILMQALTQWAEEVDDTARLMANVGNVQSAALSEDFLVEASRLSIAADRLKRLPEMELSLISRHLQSGEAAILLSPDRAAVVPAGQLFSGMVSGSGERVTFDRRFRGEQLLSSAIRSLVDGVDPVVIFVHDRETSVLQVDSQNIDVSGAAAMLEASRMDVLEWSVSTEQKPRISPDSPACWIIIAPARRTGLKPSEGEQELLRVTSDLIAEGESVLLSLYPSLLPRYGQRDPWAQLVSPLGIDVRTGEVICESSRGADGESQVQMVQVLTEFIEPNPIAAALHGQSLALPLAVPLARGTPESQSSVELIATVPPSGRRWIESEWSPQSQQLAARGDQPAQAEPIPLIGLVDRRSPVDGSRQRVLVVGSGGWMLNYVADMVMPAGGERYALLYPGNHELLLSGAAWLSGLDERIASGPLSQEVARLGSIGDGTRSLWLWILLLGIPGFIALVGIGIWIVRRS
ncbi:MAG: hypothetical protein CMJ40_06325 [Phycisphaerae bacterium]|nr:hypothetical protein [Phycisphaerae bacterium]